MYTDNALMFPHRAIASLRLTRGRTWQALCDRVLALPETHEETLAFMLMMIRLNGCMGCETDSYRAMRGCSACAQQTMRRYKGEDEELLLAFEVALRDIREFAASGSSSGIYQNHEIIEIH
ncbi:MAG: hypothetical protein K8J31_07080 [Anaerolineae bacterium]|nr:hypothetical protein [Anaerolineae bacterium]